MFFGTPSTELPKAARLRQFLLSKLDDAFECAGDHLRYARRLHQAIECLGQAGDAGGDVVVPEFITRYTCGFGESDPLSGAYECPACGLRFAVTADVEAGFWGMHCEACGTPWDEGHVQRTIRETNDGVRP